MNGGSALARVRRRLDRLRWELAAALAPRRRVRTRGLTFTLPCDNRITHYRWSSYGSKEPETLDWLDRWIREDDVLFDVGANIGVYSLYAALRHPKVRVVAFEPEYANLHLLRDNIVLNGLADRIETYSIALGDRSGLSRLHVQDLTPGAALHTEACDALAVTEAGQRVVWSEGVWVMTLDDFSESRRRWPNAVKIDVDGGEARVLAGARRALASPALRTVLVEADAGGPAVAGCASLLGAAGLRRLDAAPAGSANQIWVREGHA